MISYPVTVKFFILFSEHIICRRVEVGLAGYVDLLNIHGCSNIRLIPLYLACLVAVCSYEFLKFNTFTLLSIKLYGISAKNKSCSSKVSSY